MPRKRKRRQPYYWAARSCWYVKTADNRSQIRLDPDETEAWRRSFRHRYSSTCSSLNRIRFPTR